VISAVKDGQRCTAVQILLVCAFLVIVKSTMQTLLPNAICVLCSAMPATFVLQQSAVHPATLHYVNPATVKSILLLWLLPSTSAITSIALLDALLQLSLQLSGPVTSMSPGICLELC
jgi:hypothetical protein